MFMAPGFLPEVVWWIYAKVLIDLIQNLALARLKLADRGAMSLQFSSLTAS